MRYISKTDISLQSSVVLLQPLNNYIVTQLTAVPDPLHPLYSGINAAIKSSLISQLLIEQQGLCCYCMSKLEDGKHHIEHLAPQSGFKNEEVHYYNLYLSCGSNRENKSHCGHAKNDIPIPKLMSFYNPRSSEKCEGFFKYNLQGEILPRQGYENMASNFSNFILLNSLSKQIVSVIETLNLNAEILKMTRKNIADAVMMLPDNLLQLQNAIASFKTLNLHGHLEAMSEVAIHFLDLKVQALATNQ